MSQPHPHSRVWFAGLGRVPSTSQFGVPSNYAYTLCCITTKFGMVTHMGNFYWEREGQPPSLYTAQMSCAVCQQQPSFFYFKVN